MKKKIALISGISGQDGSYLAELLLKKKYVVHGIIRRSSLINTSRLNKIYEDPFKKNKKLHLHYGDVTDASFISNLIDNILPDEIYNLAAQSHVKVSFETPTYTTIVNAIGCLIFLEKLKAIKKKKNIKFYQASTSEMFGNIKNYKKGQNENTPFNPVSPYAASKVFAHQLTKIYRESYNLFACSGILFNHESPRRGETFVTRKITIGIKNLIYGKQKNITLGNLYSKRDWGHAKKYCESMYLILQQKKPEDFVIGTGKSYSVKNFIDMCFDTLSIKLKWLGRGQKEYAIIKKLPVKYKNLKINQKVIKINKKYLRPLEVQYLKADSKKAVKKLNWKNTMNFKSLVKDILLEELNEKK